MEDEAFINGFCKSQNQGRMVSVDFEKTADEVRFIEADCAYGNCPFQGECQIAGKIREEYGGED